MSALQITDSPERTAPPSAFDPIPFGELSDRRQLEVLDSLAGRSKYWREVLIEALAESDEVPALVAAALDPASTPEHIATFIREVLIHYAERVAAVRGDELTEL